MVRQVLKSAVGCLVGLMLLLNGISHDFIHVFANHEDTVHKHCDNEGAAIESEHHHCHFLDLESPVYTITPKLSIVFWQPERYLNHYNAYWQGVAYAYSAYVFSRGPPH